MMGYMAAMFHQKHNLPNILHVLNITGYRYHIPVEMYTSVNLSFFERAARWPGTSAFNWSYSTSVSTVCPLQTCWSLTVSLVVPPRDPYQIFIQEGDRLSAFVITYLLRNVRPPFSSTVNNPCGLGSSTIGRFVDRGNRLQLGLKSLKNASVSSDFVRSTFWIFPVARELPRPTISCPAVSKTLRTAEPKTPEAPAYAVTKSFRVRDCDYTNQ